MLNEFLDWLTELIFPPQWATPDGTGLAEAEPLIPQWLAFGTTGSRGVKVKSADGKTQIMGGAMGDRAGQVDKLKAAAAGGDAEAAKKLQEQLGRANAGRLENQKVSAQIRQQRKAEKAQATVQKPATATASPASATRAPRSSISDNPKAGELMRSPSGMKRTARSNSPTRVTSRRDLGTLFREAKKFDQYK